MDDGQVTLLQGHVLDRLRELPAESVQCCVTSPPYWSLRSYGTEPQVWGGEPYHMHVWKSEDKSASRVRNGAPGGLHEGRPVNGLADAVMLNPQAGDTCFCGAWRGELGHEPTPQAFVSHLVEVFAEVRRVLKPDGVLFVNLGDSYSGSGKGVWGTNSAIAKASGNKHNPHSYGINAGLVPEGTKAKSLVLIPERFVLAMSDDGWYARSRIAWCKKAPMPESVRDRPTNAWEPIYMFTKSATYFWDQDAVREREAESTAPRRDRADLRVKDGWADAYFGDPPHGIQTATATGSRNMWNYWLLSPDPEPEAHFATFPRAVPQRCIAAATSDRGECPKCGKPWVRVVSRTKYEPPTVAPGVRNVDESRGDKVRKLSGAEYNQQVKTFGERWAPQCAHDLPPIPQMVLDPFVGSGTTTAVARSMLRRSIGIDLSEDYLHDIALGKNAQMALMPPPDLEPAS